MRDFMKQGSICILTSWRFTRKTYIVSNMSWNWFQYNSSLGECLVTLNKINNSSILLVKVKIIHVPKIEYKLNQNLNESIYNYY